MKPKINPRPQEPARALHPKQGLRIRARRLRASLRKDPECDVRLPAVARVLRASRILHAAVRSLIRTSITAGHRIITGDRRLTIAGRRRRYPCLITCFSSPERVLIFGSAGLNRWRGQAYRPLHDPYCHEPCYPKYDPCYPKYDPCCSKYDPCCSMPELPDCEEFKDIKCAIKDFLCKLSDDDKKKYEPVLCEMIHCVLMMRRMDTMRRKP